MPDQTALAESIKAEILAKPQTGLLESEPTPRRKLQQAIELAIANIEEAGGADLTVFAANDCGIIDLECETEESKSVSEEKQ